MKVKLSALLISTGVLLSCAAPSAFADGMPSFKETKPQPILTPLDTKEQPVNVKPETPATQGTAAPLLATPTPAPAPEARVVEVQQENPSFFGLSVGMYDPFTHNKKATAFNAEWLPGTKIAGILQPIFGAMITTRGSLLGYGGIGLPLKMSEHIKMLPSIALGAYKKGGGYDLDQTLVYRLGTEIAYQFEDKSRIGLNLHVITNGKSLEPRDRTEVIGISYTVPLTSSPSVPADQMPAPLVSPAAAPAPAADTVIYQ